MYVALPIYSYKLFCSSSGEGIYEHINMDCGKLLKERVLSAEKVVPGRGGDVCSSTAFILDRLCHPIAWDEVADGVNLQKS